MHTAFSMLNAHATQGDPAWHIPAHLHDLKGTPQALFIVVGHPHSLGQALPLALSQAPVEAVIRPGVNNGEAWPMLLVELHGGLAQAFQAALFPAKMQTMWMTDAQDPTSQMQEVN